MGQLTKIFQLRGFLHKHGTIFLGTPAELHRHGRRRLAVNVDADVEVLSHCFAYSLKLGNGFTHASARIDDVVAVSTHEARFTGRPTFTLSPQPVSYVVFLGSPFIVGIFSMWIDANFVTGLPAQELPDRLAERLPQNGPLRNLHAAHG